jgi:hypothetical protein
MRRFEGSGSGTKQAHHLHRKEIAMKRTIQAALVVAALLNGSYALADDPANVLLAQVTYAEMHAGELGNAVSAFPSEGRDDAVTVPSQWTHADRNPGGIVEAESAFPSEAPEYITLPARSTYADRFANERNMQARGESDPALSE